MSAIVMDMPQRSAEWFTARLGRLTGSSAADMLATIKTGEAAARRDLRMRLVCERLTGQSQEDGYTNATMQRGVDMEPAALASYEALTGEIAMPCGFLSLGDVLAGCSPDGVIGDMQGLVSIKCPKTSTHVGYIRGGVFPSSYVPQMLHEFWVSGAKYYDFLSFDDRLPETLQTFYLRVQRDDAAVADYAAKATAFLAEVAAEEHSILGLALVR